jgi:hypothetical protein
MLHDLVDDEGIGGLASSGLVKSAKTANPAAYERVQFMKYFRGFRNNA